MYTNKSEMHKRMSEEKDFWDRRPLPEDVVEYACTDVLLLHRLVTVLKNRMTSKEQEEWKLYSTAYTTLVRSVDDPAGVVVHDGIPLYGIADYDKVCERRNFQKISSVFFFSNNFFGCDGYGGTVCDRVREETGRKGALEEEHTGMMIEKGREPDQHHSFHRLAFFFLVTFCSHF